MGDIIRSQISKCAIVTGEGILTDTCDFRVSFASGTDVGGCVQCNTGSETRRLTQTAGTVWGNTYDLTTFDTGSCGIRTAAAVVNYNRYPSAGCAGSPIASTVAVLLVPRNSNKVALLVANTGTLLQDVWFYGLFDATNLNRTSAYRVNSEINSSPCYSYSNDGFGSSGTLVAMATGGYADIIML